jgi:hypothetical protein
MFKEFFYQYLHIGLTPRILRLVLAVVTLYIISITSRQFALSLSITNAPTVVYNIQSIATSASVTSVFSLPVSTNILDLNISEFIS